MFCFFSSSPPSHRHLHSFPTRRSSDLTSVDSRMTTNATESTITTAPISEESPMCSARIRSEEHTSELQSLRHLVCRLLLEKKKKIEQAGRYSNKIHS